MKRNLLATRDVVYRKAITSSRSISHLSSLFSFSFIIRILLISGAIFFTLYVYAQPGNVKQQTDFRKVLTERSAKIINTLSITDSAEYYRVQNILVDQYINLNAIHDENKVAVKGIKDQSMDDAAKTEAIKKQEEKKSSKLLQLHAQFIAQLKKDLSDDQLDKVKDGMTYRVFPITYTAFLDMIPTLTAEQKDKIYIWLKEARELAMDEGSSEDKHKVFGKYKGRINNYLSAAGYDMKKEGEEWQKRIKEREPKN